MKEDFAEFMGNLLGIVFSIFLTGLVFVVMFMMFGLMAKYMLSPFLHWLNL